MLENLLKSMGFNRDEIAGHFKQGVAWIQGNFDKIHADNAAILAGQQRMEALLSNMGTDSPPTTFQLENPTINERLSGE